MSDDWYSLKEVSLLLHLDKRTVLTLVNKGELIAKQVIPHTAWKFDTDSVNKWMDQHNIPYEE